jgi:hypothetical protein
MAVDWGRSKSFGRVAQPQKMRTIKKASLAFGLLEWIMKHLRHSLFDFKVDELPLLFARGF